MRGDRRNCRARHHRGRALLISAEYEARPKKTVEHALEVGMPRDGGRALWSSGG
jgi:hypothetical protein